ncbi:DUF3575 domain-containing protein [Marinilongibacter aquaticus]|uniref:DUF3575 domain-containing protein n=1 Tax=Marinilongibacter aquaticus TaxID=2975157 RepID=UPI0021BD3560|nr:DUF3575 domain-containing protein [Marinilongibacter aquaticus]UBM57950.1 DUF3575 domain-containing protein [Marinilongibacter aquaticus]
MNRLNMRKFALTLCACLFFGFAQAQHLKLNAVGLINKQLDLGLELGKNKFGFEFDLGYSFKPWSNGVKVNGKKETTKRHGYLLGLRGNYYINPKEGLDGLYVSPFFQQFKGKIKFDDGHVRQERSTFGAIAGYKGLMGEHLGYLVEAGVGFNVIYRYTRISDDQRVVLEESIPILGTLSRLNVPFRASLIYRFN